MKTFFIFALVCLFAVFVTAEAFETDAQIVEADFKGIWDKIKCLAKCLKNNVPLEKILQVVLKCKSDLNCYKNELGEEAMRCAGQCMKLQVMDVDGVADADLDVELSEKLFKRISKKFRKVGKLTKKAFNTYRKYRSLIPLEDQLMSEKFFKKVKKFVRKVSKKLKSGIIGKAKCILKCLKGSVSLPKLIEVVTKCKTDKKCYLKYLGQKGAECAAKCL